MLIRSAVPKCVWIPVGPQGVSDRSHRSKWHWSASISALSWNESWFNLWCVMIACKKKTATVSLLHGPTCPCLPELLCSWSVNICLVRDILERGKEKNLELGLISTDQEKAFGWVEHSYLWRTLDEFGMDPLLVSMVKILYQDVDGVLKINGELSVPFKVQQGISRDVLSLTCFVPWG